MNYYLIVGFGFGEMRTIASKLVEKLSAKYGEKTVLREQFGVLRAWTHNDESSKNFVVPDSLSGLARFGDRLLASATADTQHVVIHGPGVQLNLDKIINHFSSNDTSTATKTKFTKDANITTYVFKTNESSSAMANRLQAQWDTTVDDMTNSGTGIVNPTTEQIQVAKDAYYDWCSDYANKSVEMFGNYDEESWQAWGGWNDDLSPTSVGTGVTDVNTFARKDGTTSKFTPHTHQLYWISG